MSTVIVSNVHLDSVGNNRIHLDGSNVSIVKDGVKIITANSTILTVSDGVSNGTIGNTPSGTSIGTFRYFVSNTAPNNSYIAADDVYPKNDYLGLYNAIGDIDGSAKVLEAVSSFQGTLAYGNGVFVGSYYGYLTYSYDADLWYTLQATTSSQKQAEYGNGIFVSAMADGNGYYSANGTSWSPLSIYSSSTYGGLTSLKYLNGRWFAGSESGYLFTTTTPTVNNWSFAYNVSGKVMDIAYGGGKYVLVSSISETATSTNGTSWTAGSMLGGGLNSVTYGKSLFVAVGTYGKIYSSPDGTTWTSRNPTWTENRYFYNLEKVQFGNNSFLIGGENLYLNSDDGINWYNTKVKFSIDGGSMNATVNDIIFANSRFYVVSYPYIGMSSQDSKNFYVPTSPLYPSTNGTNIFVRAK